MEVRCDKVALFTRSGELAAARVLIMTHSDPRTDSRILKTHEVAKSLNGRVSSIGVADPESRINPSANDIVAIRSTIRILRDKLGFSLAPGSLMARLLFGAIYFEIAVKMMGHVLVFRPSIVHCNDWFLLPVAVLAKTVSRAKLIYDAHELESQTPPNKNFSGLFVEKLERSLWPTVDYFTTVSPPIDNWYQEKMGQKDSEVILNAPKLAPSNNSSIGPQPIKYFQEKFGLSKTTKVYLYIGLLGTGRGIENILEAFSCTTTDSAVVFMGYGSFQQKIVDEGRFNKRILFHERVPHDQVVSLAKNADFGLCLIENASLSDYYCIPNKLLEYAFAGVPVVASRLPEIQRIVEEYGLGQCFDNSTEELLEVLIRNMTQSKTETTERRNLRELSWEAQADKLAKVFLSVHKGKSKGK